MLRGKDIALSLLAVGTAAAAGYVLRSGRSRTERARSRASVGARVVEPAAVPAGATVVDVGSRRLREIPGAREAIRRAIRTGATDEWTGVTLDSDGSWEAVDALRRSLPYHEADGGAYNGVYVRSGDRIVVVDAVGWARLAELTH